MAIMVVTYNIQSFFERLIVRDNSGFYNVCFAIEVRKFKQYGALSNTR
jgi:hypothetical protein